MTPDRLNIWLHQLAQYIVSYAEQKVADEDVYLKASKSPLMVTLGVVDTLAELGMPADRVWLEDWTIGPDHVQGRLLFEWQGHTFDAFGQDPLERWTDEMCAHFGLKGSMETRVRRKDTTDDPREGLEWWRSGMDGDQEVRLAQDFLKARWTEYQALVEAMAASPAEAPSERARRRM